VDGLWATKSEGVGLIVRAISFQGFQATVYGPDTGDPPTLVRYRWTDGRTDVRHARKTALCTIVRRAVKQRQNTRGSIHERSQTAVAIAALHSNFSSIFTPYKDIAAFVLHFSPEFSPCSPGTRRMAPSVTAFPWAASAASALRRAKALG